MPVRRWSPLLLLLTTAAAPVGRLGDPARLGFDGDLPAPPARLRHVLAADPVVQAAAEPDQPLPAYRAALDDRLRVALQTAGHPRPAATVTPAADHVQITLAPGPRRRPGPVVVDGDTPGHEQYTRNMVTAASTADLAVLLLDARKGVLTQTRRHSYLVKLMGVGQVVLAINKMDLVDFDQGRFDEIVAEYRAFADEIGLTRITAIPVSGLRGDNVTDPSDRMAWYDGPTLLHHLETVPVDAEAAEGGRVRHAGAVGEPARSGLPWFCRVDRVGHSPTGRRGAAGAVRPHVHNRAHRDGRRRSGAGGGRPVGDADAFG